ncbi:UV excision repair protein Rad23 [Yasminevirus sp. GU-2018]|uniref:UV excision repair protein Rad23 n=1 Tax=Yasminevirus sp. GU-2018 TaxID=2420051 RepID=A0A5K0U8L1_9VIRU|nr:UV excision repair protein Rad23 [Yasminevirus sp. GU-2018]
MSRKVVVKMWTGEKTEVVLAENEGYTELVDKLSQLYPPAPNKCFRFVCKGKIITSDNFDIVDSGAVMLVLEGVKPTPSVASQPASQPTTQKPLTQQNSSGQQSNEPTYTYDQVKATMIVFLDFIKSNPQIKQIYDTDYPQLVTEIIHNPIIGKVLKEMLSQSTQILDAIKNGRNISVNIGEDGAVNEISMTPEDGLAIDDLVKMGFNANDAVVAYLKNGKDKERTVNALLERNF